jgi:hypothetical protein
MKHTIMLYFIALCINFAFLYVLESFTTNPIHYFAAGSVCGCIIYAIVTALNR